MSSKVIDAMGLVSELNKTHGVEQKGGKKYTQVVHRMEAFRTVFGLECGIDTQIVVNDGQRVVVKATVTDHNGHVIGAGTAEEIRGQGHVNKTSALENCETSAIGRALASIGLSGGEYASANEMEAVPRKQRNLEQSESGGGSGQEPSTSTVNETPSDPVQEQYDKELYVSLSKKLESINIIGGVHNLFAETKPVLKEIKERNPNRARLLLELFQEHEKRLGG